MVRLIRTLLRVLGTLIGVGLILLGLILASVDHPEPVYAEFPRYGRILLAAGVAWFVLYYWVFFRAWREPGEGG